MTPKRPRALKWIGEMYPDGRPARYLEFVPPRDLDEAETDALSQEQLAVIRQHPDLYKEVPQKEPAKRQARMAAAAPEPEPTTDESDAAETPASDGDNAAESEG